MTAKQVAELMAELLDLDDIATDDDFFDMGGTSILALRLVAEIEKRWGATIALINLVHDASPTGIATSADRATAGHGAE